MGTPVCASAGDYPAGQILIPRLSTTQRRPLGSSSASFMMTMRTRCSASLKSWEGFLSLKGHSGRESTQLRMQERPGCLPF